jgi:hypothetical protein
MFGQKKLTIFDSISKGLLKIFLLSPIEIQKYFRESVDVGKVCEYFNKKY